MSETSKRRLHERFVRLMRESGAETLEINRRKGDLDEFLRTPQRAHRRGDVQPEYLAGVRRSPDQTRRRHARPEYSETRRLPDGTTQRVHVDLKSDQVHTMSRSAAVARARQYTDVAVRKSFGAQIRSRAPRRALREMRQRPRIGPLPQGEPQVIRFLHEPALPIQEAMIREFFRTEGAGSPISEVHFGTTVYRRRGMDSSEYDRF
jgi:hypothetical protein